MSPTSDRRRVYLDYNATAPVRPEVREATWPLLFGEPETGAFGNASSVHWAGQAARKHLEAARLRIAQLVQRKPSEVLFPSGGTEADNLALFGTLLHPKAKAPRLVLSAVEHPAVMAAADRLRERGVDVQTVSVDPEGRLDLDGLDRALTTPTTLVAVMAVNNETGVILDVPAVVERAHRAGAQVLVDAVQAPGRIPIPAADLVVLSGHKIGGLKGAGCLLRSAVVPMRPEVVGGPQERGLRAGTEDVAAVVALDVALHAAEAQRARETERLGALQQRLESGLCGLPGVRIVGAGAPRVAGVTTAVFEDVGSEAVLQGLDLEGFAASSGSACSSGSLEPSHVLTAMGYDGPTALSAVRFSLGWASTEADVDALLDTLPTVVARARA